MVDGANLSRDKMTERLLEFGKKAEGADVALFFYAGHGIAINRTNYLLPVDADLKSAVTTGPVSEVELEFWRSINDSNKPEELNAYLTNYPNGTFKSLALARIASLQDGPSTATRNLTTGIDPATFTEAADQAAEEQIGLDKGQRRDVQRRLTALGLDTRVSGKFDETTRRGDHALAGRTRLSQERFPQQAATQGFVDGNRRDHANRFQRRFGRSAGSSCAPKRWRRRRRRSPWRGSRCLHRRSDGWHDGRHVPPLIIPIASLEVRPEPRFDRIETGLWILDLTRFLDANRSPPRIKSGAGFRLKTLSQKARFIPGFFR